MELEPAQVQEFVALMSFAVSLILESSAESNALAEHLTGIGAAAHGEDIALFAGDILVSAGKQGNQLAFLGQIQRSSIGEQLKGDTAGLYLLFQDRGDFLAFLCCGITDVHGQAALGFVHVHQTWRIP